MSAQHPNQAVARYANSVEQRACKTTIGHAVHCVIGSSDDRLCESLAAALEQVGGTAVFLRSGLGVMNSAHARDGTLVLLDHSLPDIGGLEVARALNAAKRCRFVLIGQALTTSATVEAMKLGALTVLEKPVAVAEMIALLRSARDESRTSAERAGTPWRARAPRSVAERWAQKVVKGCEADGDLRTLAAWASVAGLSYSSLCETCRLVGVQPLAARDLTRVLRAVVQSQAHGCRIAELLDVCDRRTLNALMARAAIDPWRRGHEISIGQFLTAQRFVPSGNAGLVMLRSLLPQ